MICCTVPILDFPAPSAQLSRTKYHYQGSRGSRRILVHQNHGGRHLDTVRESCTSFGSVARSSFTWIWQGSYQGGQSPHSRNHHQTWTISRKLPVTVWPVPRRTPIYTRVLHLPFLRLRSRNLPKWGLTLRLCLTLVVTEPSLL